VGAVTLPGMFPPMPAVARILGRFDRSTLESFLAVTIDLLDTLDGDADNEEPADLEASDGDDRDVSYTEWQSRGRLKGSAGIYTTGGEFAHEDDELDDAAEEDDAAEDNDPAGVVDEDGVNTVTQREYLGLPIGSGPGCMISDDDGRPLECDVPTLAVVNLEHNPFDDRRQPLGYSNLLSSFVSGEPVRSADTGAMQPARRWELNATPGVPV